MTDKQITDVATAIEKLAYAVGELVERRTERHDDRWLTCASRYDELRASIGGAQGTGGRSWAFRSMPLIWVDAVDLLGEIDGHTGAWSADLLNGSTPPTTPARLQALRGHGWTPDSVHAARTITARVTGWVRRANALLDPVSVKEISAPCPSCGRTHTYRYDNAGERIKRPALQLKTDGCECLICRAFWPPEHFELLASVLREFPIKSSRTGMVGAGRLTCVARSTRDNWRVMFDSSATHRQS